MESANLQHQLQELFVGYSSLVSAPRTSLITHECSPNFILENGNSYNNPYLMDQSLACSRENENLWFNFSSNYQPNDEEQHQQHQQQISTIYSSIDHQSPTSYGGFQAGISAAGSNNHNHNTNYYTNNNNNNNNNVFSSSLRKNNHNNSSSSASTLDLLSSSSLSSSMGYNLQAADHHLDFLSASPNYSNGFNKNRPIFFGYDHHNHGVLQDSINNSSPSNSSSNKTSSTNTGVVGRAKRPVNSLSMPKKSNINSESSKKSCSTSRSSCPPLKVRKEKLGDRISALQRLVAPFGKTDTSSVLTEAIGYIQFLHDQVETLSMPYLASSQSKPYQKLQPAGSNQEDNGIKQPARKDLKSRGLCLMPVSCASFIHGYD